MILTLKLSSRVPGKELKVDGQVEFDTERLDREKDKGAFLLGIIHRLRSKVEQEVKTKAKQPINGFQAVPHTDIAERPEKPPISQPGANLHG